MTTPVSTRRRRPGARPDDGADRTVVSELDWRRPAVRRTWRTMHVMLLVLLLVWCLGPLLMLAKFAVTPTQDIIRTPLAIFPNGIAWENLTEA